MVTIESADLRVQINELGAELYSVQGIKSGTEYLWCGDVAYWKSRSPVLFPIVGALYEGRCRIEGQEYAMRQHGIARHLVFEVVEQSDAEAVMELRSTAETRLDYPYDFVLRIGYRLEGARVVVSYEVENPSEQEIYFQLGAHPGFNFRNFDCGREVQGYFEFNDRAADDKLVVSHLNASGYLAPGQSSVELCEGRIAITKDTFSGDALILEGAQSHDISLLDSDGETYIRVRYDAPVVGLWSKPVEGGGYAPFTCIEPWYGRCDAEGYDGQFKDRDWTQQLAPSATFCTSIEIEVMEG